MPDYSPEVKRLQEILGFRKATPAPKQDCAACRRFFKRFRCGKNVGDGECDCPKCQGYCKCGEA